jgi:hypothetical protein
MKNLVIIFLLLIVAGEVFTLIKIRNNKPVEKVLSLAVSPVPILTPIPTPNPTSTPTITPIPTPKPTAVPQPTFSSEEINKLIDRFASQYSVDPNVLRHIAVCESGFNPLAHKLSYAGLYQFGPITWENIRSKFGEDIDIDLRFNAEEAVQTAAYAISIGKKAIWPNCYP